MTLFIFMCIIVLIIVVVLVNKPKPKTLEEMLEEREQKRQEQEWLTHTPRPRRIPDNMVYAPDRSAFMALECFHIILSSIKVETVYSRLNVLYDVLAGIEGASKMKNDWKLVVDKQVEFYSVAYYDKKVEPDTLLYILNPTPLLDRWTDFQDESLFLAVERYAQNQTLFIEQVKTKVAKLRTIQKVIEEVEKLTGFVKSPTSKINLIELKEKLEEMKITV